MTNHTKHERECQVRTINTHRYNRAISLAPPLGSQPAKLRPTQRGKQQSGADFASLRPDTAGRDANVPPRGGVSLCYATCPHPARRVPTLQQRAY